MRRFGCVIASVLAFASTATVADTGLWPWASQNPPKPPVVPPYQIPTFTGAIEDFRAPPPDWVKAPRVDGDAVYAAILACYPAVSRWRLNVDLQARLKTTPGPADYTDTAIGRSYAAIVARLPLYSADDHEREREREYKRRVDTAKIVAQFIAQIAERNRALRDLALAASMEQRARVRVNEGIADATEQIKYLDKVAASEAALINAESKIMEARLELVALCRDDVADSINTYLTSLAQLPTVDKTAHKPKGSPKGSTP